MCPFCEAEMGKPMKGRNLCERHELEASNRASNYNLLRGDALDQLWDMYEEESKEKT
jgi:hypothetical protein